MTPDADSIVVEVTRKCCRNSTEKAHRPRAFPSTAGLSGNYQLFDNALSVFDELALHSRPMVFNGEIAKINRQGFLRKRQHVNAGTDLQPHAGHLLPRTTKVSDARKESQGWQLHTTTWNSVRDDIPLIDAGLA